MLVVDASHNTKVCGPIIDVLNSIHVSRCSIK